MKYLYLHGLGQKPNSWDRTIKGTKVSDSSISLSFAEMLKGKKATCYPGFEKHLHGAIVVDRPAISDGKIITGRGIGAAMAFSLEIVKFIDNIF